MVCNLRSTVPINPFNGPPSLPYELIKPSFKSACFNLSLGSAPSLLEPFTNTLDIETQSLSINYINPTNQNRLNLIMKLHNEGWSNKRIVTFLNLNGIKRRNKKDDYKVKKIFMCLKKLKIREKRKSNIKYKLGKWELWREY